MQNLTGDRIAFFGKMAVGKSHCANILVAEYGYGKIAFADRLKKLARELFFIEGKDGPARKIYQELGSALRSINEDVWISPVLQRIAEFPNRPWVIDDVRYPNEYRALEEAGFLMVRVMAYEFIRQERIQTLYPATDKEAQRHISETALDSFEGDAFIVSVDGSTPTQLERLTNWGK